MRNIALILALTFAPSLVYAQSQQERITELERKVVILEKAYLQMLDYVIVATDDIVQLKRRVIDVERNTIISYPIAYPTKCIAGVHVFGFKVLPVRCSLEYVN